jgi:hypothetical protein
MMMKMENKTPTQRDLEKIIAGILFVLQQWGKEMGHHALFKVLYFADRKKLSQHGIAIFNDWYVKMPYGPVPSWTRDLLTQWQKKSFGFKYRGHPLQEVFDFYKEGNKPRIKAKMEPDLKYLAPKDVQILVETIAEFKDVLDDETFLARTLKAHDFAWDNAEMNGKIPVRNIIIAGGGGKDVLNSFDDREELKDLLS